MMEVENKLPLLERRAAATVLYMGYVELDIEVMGLTFPQ